MAYEHLDAALLPVLAAARGPLTAAQIRERCRDPWAPALVEEWLRQAFDRRLVIPDRPAPGSLLLWSLTARGRRKARDSSAGS